MRAKKDKVGEIEHENIHSVDDFTDPIRSQFPQRLLQMLKLFIFNVKK